MKNHVIVAAFVVCAGMLAALSCRRSDLRTVVVGVPDMGDERAVRIVTNAVLDEVVARYDGIQNDCEIDLAKGVVLYHESRRLLSPEYQRQIEARLAEVGYAARVRSARLNPPGLVPTADGPIQMWPDRHTAVIDVSGMRSATDANVVVDAIGYARLGRDDGRIVIRRDSRSIVLTIESLRLANRNIQHAVACAGFSADGVPARLGAADAVPHGWTPARL